MRLFRLTCLLPVLAMMAGTAAGGEPAELSALVDRQLAARWSEAHIQPAPAASDAEFLRRVYLDLTGKVPSVPATRAFLEDRSPDKRRRLVEQLLKSSDYAEHFTNVWRAILLPDSNDPQALGAKIGFEAWLRDRLARNVGYDKLAREIVTTGQQRRGPRNQPVDDLALLQDQGGQLSPIGFYIVNQAKPENLAGATARLFLGSRIECAQCHNHPMGRWKQEQFWQFAAFFTPARAGQAPEIRIPKTGQAVTAHFLDGKEPVLKGTSDPRLTLAEWMTASDNPYFARTAVNRVWACFLGTGLIEPVDDLTRDEEKDPLLDELAQRFIEHKYDLKYLIEGIVLSRAYGLTSRGGQPGAAGPQLFARMAVRGLAPEQIFDSLVQATGYEGEIAGVRAEFVTRFTDPTERPTEFQTSILQALHLMNGKFIAEATSPERSATLAAVADAPFFDTAKRIEVLYLAAYSRKPTQEELARFVPYVERGGPSGEKRQALADVFWALLNSSEFILNH